MSISDYRGQPDPDLDLPKMLVSRLACRPRTPAAPVTPTEPTVN
ncbi:MAG: hypothetical protein WC617_16525 [Rhodanobacter sp.]|jgi:hypothetical protein